MSNVDLPNIREPFIDQRSGQISRPWWLWLQQLMVRIGGSDSENISAIVEAIRDLIRVTNAQANEIGAVAVPPPIAPPYDPGEAVVFQPPGAYVNASEASQASPVQSVFGRTGDVAAATGDYTVEQVTNAASLLGTLGQFAATTSAELASVITDETGSGALVFGDEPTLTRPNIVGTNTNDNADAGSVGEYLSNTASGAALSSNVPASVATLPLDAGDWEVSGVVMFIGGPAVTVTRFFSGINTSPIFGAQPGTLTKISSGMGNDNSQIPTPTVRISLPAATTVHLVGQATFSGGTVTADGFIQARRAR